jgi:hypothetical protein
MGIITESFYYWVTFLLIIEIILAKDSNYAIMLLYFLLIILISSLLSAELDLLFILMLPPHTSVLYTVSVTLFYFYKYTKKLKNFFAYSPSYYSTAVVVLFSMSDIMDDFTVTGSTVKLWFLSLFHSDMFDMLKIKFILLLFSIHLFSYKFFLVEMILLNIFIFFVVILTIYYIGLVRSSSNKKQVSVWSIVNRSIKSIAPAVDSKIYQINKFKRQFRRLNSSLVRHKYDALCYKS